jgi:hypothetical protein
VHKGVRDRGSHLHTLCRDTGPAFDINAVASRVCFGQKKKKKTHRVKPYPKHTFTPFFPNNTFFLPLHIPPTRCHHLCRETRPCSSVEHAQTMAFPTTKHSKEQESGDEKETWCLSLPSLTPHTIVFLCVSSIHTTLERSLTSIASVRIAFPPKPNFQHKHHCPTRVSIIRLW